MESINVLGDECERRAAGFESSESAMAGIGLCGGDALAAPVVPLPDELRIAREGLGRGESFGAMVVPQAAGAAEGGNARFGGDARAGEDGDGASAFDPVAGLSDVGEADV